MATRILTSATGSWRTENAVNYALTKGETDQNKAYQVEILHNGCFTG
jgi:hypothetical protein